MDEFTVTFKPLGKKVSIRRGMDLLTAAVKGGIILNSSCGGEGLCGKCKVIIKKGEVKTDPSGHISETDKRRGVVLACQSMVEGDIEVSIPRESLETFERPERRQKDIEEFSKGITLKQESAFEHSPAVRKIYLELPKPTLDDNVSDLDRIYRELKDRFEEVSVVTKLANVKHLGEVLRESDFKITITLGHKDGVLEIISFEPGDTTRFNFGFAFDIGTTTVTGQLIDLNTKEILGTRIAYNRQASFGSDVITRIIYGSQPDGLVKLNEAILDNLNEMIDDLAKTYNISLSDLFAVTCAGNMTMMHLLLKIDPTYIRREPYVPTTTIFPTINSSEAGFNINPKGVVFCLPGVSTYIGGDVIAGVLSCGLFDAEELSLLVDIGTNGEVVLGTREWMMACSASAGPAFEGSGVAFGMKAVKGAIQKVEITENLDVNFKTIAAVKPKGICGSGYIDLLNWMLKRGLIERDGKINKEINSKRIRKGKSGYEFIVAFKSQTQIDKDIVINEDDIENLKRSKGAIYSAIVTLLNKVEKNLTDLKKIYIAGGFGNYIDIESAISIGLLPDLDRRIYEFVGNSSLAGARLALLSYEAFLKAKDIHTNITYLDLSSEPKYMDEYVASLFFPHTDLGRFPSVRL